MERPAGEALPARGALLLLVLAAALLLFRLGDVPLLGPDEPRYVRVAVEMQRAGEWVTPTLQGRPWLEKPALYYWLAGAAFRWLGETEAAARLPAVLAALLMVLTTALIGARLLGTSAGLHAGFVLATAPLVFAYGRAATMDMLVAAFATAAIGLLALGLLGVAGRFAVPGAYVFMGLATLAKGPLGFLLPALVVVGFALFTRDVRLVARALSPVGIVLFLLVAAPWYLAVYASQGQAFVDVFLLDHNLQRFTSTVHRHPGGIHYYVPVLFGLIFPWSGLVLPAAACAAPRRSRVEMFVVLWLLLPFLFFSAAGSKLPGYILPCLPPLALLIGRALATITAGGAGALPFWAGPRAVALVGLGLGALVAAAPALLREREPLWTHLLPVAAWVLVSVLLASRAWDQSPATAPNLLRVGAVGLLLLASLVAPTLLERHESGRRFFLPARGREVLAWGAWRTAWMAGYFYNDGRVREIAGLEDVTGAVAHGPALVLCGPSERRAIEGAPGLQSVPLTEGARQNALLRVSRR
ncbi:MAG TPA: glycosyltransferase family 39 protein [Vicinamibacteria bacterium]|nr:glycosyltransferase family 39 protein [Vicinamibacteria bacterium]